MNDGWLSITLNQINIFLQVVERKGFLAASRQLHMTQSAVSKSIARMEKQLEMLLFERNTRNIELTEEGQQLYRQWRSQFELMRDSYAELEKQKQRKENILKIGLSSTTRPERFFQKIRERFLPYGTVPKFTNVFRNAYTLRLCFVPQEEILFVDDYYDYVDNSAVVRRPVEDEYNGIICGWKPDCEKQSLKKFLDIL